MSFINYITLVGFIGTVWWLYILHKYYKDIPAQFLAIYSLSICVVGFITSLSYTIFDLITKG